MRVSVLDTGYSSIPGNHVEALHDTIKLACLADDLGFHRFWVAEHHSAPMHAAASSSVIAAYVAAKTNRLRIGAGGVLFRYTPLLLVAEAYRTLSALAPGRVDLGLVRSGIDMDLPHHSNLPIVQPEVDDRARIELLLDLVGHSQQLSSTESVTPFDAQPPEVWMLGSTSASAQLALDLGLPFAGAYHLDPTSVTHTLNRRRVAIHADRESGGPTFQTAISVPILAADTQSHANAQASQILAVNHDPKRQHLSEKKMVENGST